MARRVLHSLGATTRLNSTLAAVAAAPRFRITFAGNDEFSQIVLESLVDAKHVWEAIHVVTNDDRRTGRNGCLRQISPVRIFADKLGLPTTLLKQGKNKRSLDISTIQLEQPSPWDVLVTASFGRILPRSILHKFSKNRRFNVHPSLLPLLRGAAPIQHAIALGHLTTGVSIAGIEPISSGIDSGNIWMQEPVLLHPNDTFLNLRGRLARLGGSLLVKSLENILTGMAHSFPQDHQRATHAPRVDIHSSQVDLKTWDAFKIDRFHRGIGHQKALRVHMPFLDAWLLLKELSIRSPPLEPSPALHHAGDAFYDSSVKEIVIRCADRTEIAVSKVQQEGRKVLHAHEWQNGLPADRRTILEFRSGIHSL